ncbi:MAG TPA: RluA family pseudouridine synthase [Thermoanaerobaculia bacterium]|nr:RluA family pseudouridine synthase [Thermoanaerobaculia bacterium]
MSGATKVFRVERGDVQGRRERLDRALLRHLAHIPSISRTQVQAWIEEGRVRVNGALVLRPGGRLAIGDEVELTRPEAPALAAPTATEMPLAVLYEDDWLLAVNKPPGLLVHPTPRVREGTLWNGLLFRARSWGEGQLPGLVHRLDRDTSGVLLVAKTRPVLTALARALRSQEAEKEYLALVYGRVEGSKGRIDLGILRDPEDRRRWAASKTAGQPSSTLWERLGESERAPLTLLACRLLTGRTHQIRVHLEAKGWPIVGDPLYGEPRYLGITDAVIAERCREFPRQALHARRLAFMHPVRRERVTVEAPVPGDLGGLLAAAGMG